MRAQPGGRWEHYSHLYVTIAKLILLTLRHLEWCGWHGGNHDVQTLAAVLYHHKYFPISHWCEQVMAGLALLLCAIPSVQCSSDGKIFGKNIAGDCGAPLSNLIAEYLFSALPDCTEAQYHLAHVKIKLRPAVTSVTVKRLRHLSSNTSRLIPKIFAKYLHSKYQARIKPGRWETGDRTHGARAQNYKARNRADNLEIYTPIRRTIRFIGGAMQIMQWALRDSGM